MWIVNHRPRVVCMVTAAGGRIVGSELVADAERVRQRGLVAEGL